MIDQTQTEVVDSSINEAAVGQESDYRALRHYLDAIGKVPLLTHEDEIRLSEAARAGDDDAVRMLSEANLRLVVHLAYRYSRRGVSIRELIAAGNLGLVKAVKTYKARPDARFSGYAVWWVRRHIMKALMDERRTARIPLHRMPALGTLRRARNDFIDENGREPDNAELAELTGVPLKVVISLMATGSRPASLQAPLSKDTDAGATLGEVIADEEAASPAVQCERGFAFREVSALLETLSSRDAEIVRARFGLDDGEPGTCEEIGRRFGMTRERVRQIQDSAIRKMRRDHREKSRALTREEVIAIKVSEARNAVMEEFAKAHAAPRKKKHS